jgi:hypothetical protein
VDKCNTCHNPYRPDCDWNQGRCPNHPPIIKIQSKDTSKGHFYASLVKSGFRIFAGGNLAVGNFMIAGVLFVVAEIVGIVEELV